MAENENLHSVGDAGVDHNDRVLSTKPSQPLASGEKVTVSPHPHPQLTLGLTHTPGSAQSTQPTTHPTTAPTASPTATTPQSDSQVSSASADSVTSSTTTATLPARETSDSLTTEIATPEGEVFRPDIDEFYPDYSALAELDEQWNGQTMVLPPVRPLMPIENRDESNSARKKTKRRRRLRHPRSPLVALPLAIVFTLGAMFFGWVSADPLWLSLGQGSTGTITVTSCSDGRLGRVCEGQFDSTDFSAAPVRISGLPAAEKSDRATTTARMMNPDHAWAYAGSQRDLFRQWQFGLGLAAFCVLVVVFCTSPMRLRADRLRRRLGLVLVTVAGPTLLTAGIIAAALLPPL